MILEHLDHQTIRITISDTNLQNLIEHRKLVKFNGSPNYDQYEIEISLQSDDEHEARHRQLLIEQEKKTFPLYALVFENEYNEGELELEIATQSYFDKHGHSNPSGLGAGEAEVDPDGECLDDGLNVGDTLDEIFRLTGLRIYESCESIYEVYNKEFKFASAEEIEKIFDLPFIKRMPFHGG